MTQNLCDFPSDENRKGTFVGLNRVSEAGQSHLN